MPFRLSIALILGFLTSMTLGEQPPKKVPDDAGRALRNMFLTTPADKAGIQPSGDYPRVYGIAMDWPIGEHTATIVSLSDGTASVYTTGTFGILGGIGHETVRTAAKKLVRKADGHYDDSVPTADFSYPAVDHIRFFLLTFQGVRVIDVDLASITSGRSKYSTLFESAQEVLTRLRSAGEQDSP